MRLDHLSLLKTIVTLSKLQPMSWRLTPSSCLFRWQQSVASLAFGHATHPLKTQEQVHQLWSISCNCFLLGDDLSLTTVPSERLERPWCCLKPLRRSSLSCSFWKYFNFVVLKSSLCLSSSSSRTCLKLSWSRFRWEIKFCVATSCFFFWSVLMPIKSQGPS